MARGTAAWIAVAMAALSTVVVPAHASTATVHAQSFSWVPEEITILPGDSVTWVNDDNVTHTITELSCPRANDTGSCAFDHDLVPGTTVSESVPFGTPGIYEYQCVIHVFFGKITVLGNGSVLPDLDVTSLSAAPASATAPTTLRLTANLANIAPDAGAGRSDVLFQYRTGNGDWHTIGTSLANAVPAGGSTTVRILWDALGKAGDFQIRAIADGLGQVAESVETNNVEDATASVLLPPGVVNPGVDLTGGT